MPCFDNRVPNWSWESRDVRVVAPDDRVESGLGKVEVAIAADDGVKVEHVVVVVVVGGDVVVDGGGGVEVVVVEVEVVGIVEVYSGKIGMPCWKRTESVVVVINEVVVVVVVIEVVP